MNFLLDEEQELLAETLRRFVEAEYPFRRRRLDLEGGRGVDQGVWSQLADLELFALPVAEDRGGAGGSAVDLYLMFEALGRGLLAEPALSSALLGGSLLQADGEHDALLASVMTGERVLSVALHEVQSRFNLANVATRAREVDGRWHLAGEKSVVYYAPIADALIVSARTDGEELDRGGLSLFVVDPKSDGVSLRPYQTIDGVPAAEVSFVGDCEAQPLGPIGGALPLVESAVDRATLATCAEAVGIMEVLNDLTLAYCLERHAFGRQIASFQVLQHRMVDMRVAYEHAAAITMRAARSADVSGGLDPSSVSAAMAQVIKESDFVGTNAVQLHGAIGLTEEFEIGHYFKRLVAIANLFGDRDHHVRRFAATSSWMRATA